MEYIYYILCIILTSLIFIIYIKINNYTKNKEQKQILSKELENWKKQKLEELNREYNTEKNRLWEIIEQNKKLIKEEEDKKNLIISQKEEIINKEINSYKTKLQLQADSEYELKVKDLRHEYINKQRLLEIQLEDYISLIEINKTKAKSEYEEILVSLQDFQKRQESINEAIKREKELQEQTDFYRICLRPSDADDIAVLHSIESKLVNREAIAKLIYDVFISRPLKEMEKRVLNDKNPSGIYKITYIPTGEAYIGKSSNVADRWKNHLKTVCGLDGAAHQTIHTKMQDCGIQNFTFELLEEVPKDKLSEREKFYIDLYDTKSNGFNVRLG